jgi:hypothetical protein
MDRQLPTRLLELPAATKRNISISLCQIVNLETLRQAIGNFGRYTPQSLMYFPYRANEFSPKGAFQKITNRTS